jgi:hypothetical protein
VPHRRRGRGQQGRPQAARVRRVASTHGYRRVILTYLSHPVSSAVRLVRLRASRTPPPTSARALHGTRTLSSSTLRTRRRCALLPLSHLRAHVDSPALLVHPWHEDGFRGPEEGQGPQRPHHLAQGVDRISGAAFPASGSGRLDYPTRSTSAASMSLVVHSRCLHFIIPHSCEPACVIEYFVASSLLSCYSLCGLDFARPLTRSRALGSVQRSLDLRCSVRPDGGPTGRVCAPRVVLSPGFRATLTTAPLPSVASPDDGNHNY